MKFCILFLSGFTTLAFGGCLPITGDRILGRDLALANPQFAALPASLTIGFAPSPGMKRIFASGELARIAKANGIAMADPEETCFEIPMRKITVEEATSAMRRSLPAGADLNIVELSATEVPVGEVEFPPAGLEPAAPATPGLQMWRGSLRFTSTRKTPVWARVAITQKMDAVLTGRDLPPNMPIEAGALHVATWSGPLVRDRVAVRVEDVIGRVPKRGLKAGSLIPLAMLDVAPAVRRGESIRVEVNSGPAHLFFEAIAEKEARDGDLVDLRNPSTGKIFRARLEGSKAVVVIAGGSRL
jgi:flagella basal body P-ring formation protein FlgA